MIKEAYCSFEVCKLLREKGFDEPCKSYFADETDNYYCKYVYNEITDINIGVFDYLRPTHQMAMAWLREVYDIYIVFFHTNKSGWWYNITDMKDSYVFYSSEKTMCSYEDVVNVALKYVLENLI